MQGSPCGTQPSPSSIGPPRERGGKGRVRWPWRIQCRRRFNWATPRTGWKVFTPLAHEEANHRASIGPPRERGGKAASRRARTQATAGFNWATPRTGWKGGATSASTSPRHTLQLGHPANGVERGLSKACGLDQLGGASIGPPRERGGKGGSVCGTAGSGGRFNWATPRTGWKDRLYRGKAQRRFASIGPPRERGGKIRGAASAKPMVVLQLGHPANGVERLTIQATWRHAVGGFNWATPRTGWKDQNSKPKSSRPERASIGPPRERGGKLLSIIKTAVESYGFNWATPRTGWKVGYRFKRTGCACIASIGPPRERGGKAWGEVDPHTLEPMLQLGHPANGVERYRATGSRL